MLKNFIASVIHATEKLKAKNVVVEHHAFIEDEDVNTASIKNLKSEDAAINDLDTKNLGVETLKVSKKGTIQDLNVTNDATVGNNLTVTNKTKTKDLEVTNDMSVTKNATIGNNLTITNTTNTKDLNVTNDTTVGNNLTVTNKTKTKDLEVTNDATITGVLDVKKIKDNGTVYGETNDISALSVKTGNSSSAGAKELVARADHTHKIDPPEKLTIKGNDGNVITEYNGADAKEIQLTPDNTGASPKEHSSTGTAYGVGNSSKYGHLKLSDSTDSTNNTDSGTAATPKAIKTLKDYVSDNFLKNNSDIAIWGKVRIRNSVYLCGTGNSTDSTSSSDNTLQIQGVGDSSICKIQMGTGNATIFSNNDGNIYLHAHKSGSTEFAHVIMSHIVERCITPLSKLKKWYPTRQGWYRIYLVGGGGCGAAGCYNTNTASWVPSSYNGGLGSAVVGGGPGGGGGGVVYIDLITSTPTSGSSFGDDNSDDNSSGDADDTITDSSTENVALITFFSREFITGYGSDTNYSVSDTTGNRDVAISGLSNVGIIVKGSSSTGTMPKYGKSDYNWLDDYDAYAFHGGDSISNNTYGRYANIPYKLKSDSANSLKNVDISGTYNCGMCYSPNGGCTYGGTHGYQGGAGIISRASKPSINPSGQNDTIANSTHREDGYDGGYPGSKSITGVVGMLGTPGLTKNIKSKNSNGDAEYVYCNGGTGGCLSIAELYGYMGTSLDDASVAEGSHIYPTMPSTQIGGNGFLGGGCGGGGVASVITAVNDDKSPKTGKVVTMGANKYAKSYPCCVIAYMGRTFSN